MARKNEIKNANDEIIYIVSGNKVKDPNGHDIYIFVGEGQGVPGLPHQVTKEWCQNDGDFAVSQLEACLDPKNPNHGNYRPMVEGDIPKELLSPPDQEGQDPDQPIKAGE